jgi:hypothetical protein
LDDQPAKFLSVINALHPSDSVEVRELEVVRLDEKKKAGRPIKLTEARFRRMLQLIRDGNTNSAVCRIEGVDYATWRFHIQHKPEWRAELAEAEKVRDEVWRDHALEMVKSAMPKNWQAAMTYLERKYPNEFALRTVIRSTDSNGKAAYSELTKEQLLALIEASKVVEAEAPKGFNQPGQLENGTPQAEC